MAKTNKYARNDEGFDPLESEPDPETLEKLNKEAWLKTQPPATFDTLIDQENDYESSKANPLSPKSKSGALTLGVHQGSTFGFGDEALAAADTGAEAISRAWKGIVGHKDVPGEDVEVADADPGFNKKSPKIQKSWAPEPYKPPQILPGKPTPLSDVKASDQIPEEDPVPEKPSLRDYYAKMRDGYRDDLKEAAAKHPWQYGGGQLVGAAFAPIPGVAEINPAVRMASEAAAMAKVAKTAEEIARAEELAKAAKLTDEYMRLAYGKPIPPAAEGATMGREAISPEAMAELTKYSNLNNRARHMAATGSATGAVSGLGTSNADLTEGDFLGAAEDMAVPTLVGAGAGYGYAKAGQWLAREKTPFIPYSDAAHGDKPLMTKVKAPFWKTAATVAASEGLGILAGGAIGSIGGPEGVIGGVIAGAVVPPMVKKLISRYGQKATAKALSSIDAIMGAGDQILEEPVRDGVKFYQLFGKAGMPVALLRTPQERRAKIVELMHDPEFAGDIENGLSKLASADPDVHPDGGLPEGSAPVDEEPENYVRLKNQFNPDQFGAADSGTP